MARIKIPGTHLKYVTFKQLPVIPPSTYEASDIAFLLPRVLELQYTAWDLENFARDMGYEGPPFGWDMNRRGVLRAELDAYFACLYGLSRDELRYNIEPRDIHGENFPGETFRVLKESEWKQNGEYRTRRLILEAYVDLAKTSRFSGRLSLAIPSSPIPKDG
jgi:hypothetical protein